MNGKNQRNGGRLGTKWMMLMAIAFTPLLTGCGPALVGFGSVSALYATAIITTPLRSIVGGYIRQLVVGG